MAVDKYVFSPQFGKGLAYCMATNPRVYESIRDGIEVDAFPTKCAQTIAKVCITAHQRLGRGPNSYTEVMQLVTEMANEQGSITIDHAFEVDAYLAEGGEEKFNPEDAFRLFAPQLQRRAKDDAIRSHLSGVDTAEVIEMLQRSLTIGVINQAPTSRMSVDWYKDIAAFDLMETIPTGCQALDCKMKNGALKGSSFVAAGGSNAGKSSLLRQMAGICSREGGLTMFFTNETSEVRLKAFILADLTNIPFAKIMAGDLDDPALAQSLKRYKEQSVRWAPIHTMRIAPYIATPAVIFDAVKRVEDKEGRKVDGLFVDYLDRVDDGSGGTNGSYVLMRNVYQAFEDNAEENHRVNATVSQVKDKEKGQKYLTELSLSDSKHKGRIAQQVVTINVALNDQSGETERTLYIAKQKQDAAEIVVGPIDTDFAFGRFSKLSKRIHAGAKPSDAAKADAVAFSLDSYTKNGCL